MPIDEVLSPRRWAGFDLSRPLVMGILNVTPDSFSDGGRFAVAEAAIAAGRAMRDAGADIVDIGGESTRPGAEAVTSEEESARVVPVIRALAEDGIAISIDTRNAATMAAALDAGARIVNDISGLRHDPRAAFLVAARGCPVVLMHMRGTPATMGCHAHYADLVREVIDELAQRRDAALQAGIPPEAIALDPGFGFAKQGEQNLVLLRALGRFRALGHPLLAGVSRKRFIGALAGEADPARRDAGSIAAALFAANRGAAILRVHDVAGTAQALLVWRALGDEARHFE
ncbi:dihydropteroate synthase [Acidiphilium iwatense]|uniref:Dihydropteroate synthase n=1 Tax=Acidiphilium iwatense TaxID=768198 RepID=A0ABS9DSE6_9PROT|nr:dihydropteroate synthase [Acidiphilium iwatense]MCF3945651.1 dihydropteroate synthase [Acidiphilium iwatense]